MALKDLKEKLESAIFETEEPKPVQQQQVSTTPIISVPKDAAQSATSEADKSEGAFDEVLFGKLGDVMIAENLPGPDYVELKEATAGNEENLKAVIPDEEARHNAALITAFNSIKAANGKMTKEVVINSIGTYLKILDREYSNAMGELNTMWTTLVENPTQEIAQLQKEKEELSQRLEKINTSIATISAEIESAKAKHIAQKSTFEITFGVFKNKLEQDREKLKTILPD